MTVSPKATRVGIFYPSDPAGNVPSGIDSFIKGVLKFAPQDLDYLLVGATCDVAQRPPGSEQRLQGQHRAATFLPLVDMDADGSRRRIPLTVRYVGALRSALRRGMFRDLRILDFHRIEPLSLFMRDPRTTNVMLHQDMSVIRDKNSDILWKHAPAVYEYFERRLLRRADRIFCVRQSAVDRYRGIYPELADRVAFVPTWVDTDVFNPAASGAQRAAERSERRARLGLDPGSRILVFVGRLDRQKDPLLLVEAFAQLASDPGLHLAIIGDGALRVDVERRIAERGLAGRISLLGAMGGVAIAQWLRAADLFLLTSAYEGMPIAVLEALACGLPVVSTDVGEIRRVVAEGRTGRIASERSAGALAAAVVATLREAAVPERAADCVAAIHPYRPEKVLAIIHDNHRRQAAGQPT
jgi:glycosyltransferase involved in cell wall biosynthesis